MRYYATLDIPIIADFIAFETAEARDAWVNYKDPVSIEQGITAENSELKRIVMSNEHARRLLADGCDKVLSGAGMTMFSLRGRELRF